MDRPVLHSFVRELLALERLQAFAAALPSRARVSEPVLPLVLATLHEQLERGLVVLLPGGCRRARPRRGGGLVQRRRARRAPARARRPLELRPRAAAASRRRACARPRRARGRRPRRRVRVRTCRGNPAGCEAAGADPARSRSRARPRRALRATRSRGLRARRACRGARPVRCPRWARRRLPDDGPRAAPGRALRRRDRAGARVLALHPAGAASGRRRRGLSRHRAPSRSHRADAPRRRPGDVQTGDSARPRARARPRPGLRLAAGRGEAGLGRGRVRADLAQGRLRARPLPAGAAVLVRGAAARDRRPRPRRGGERAEGLRQRRQPRRRRVPARRRGAAHRQPAQARRLAAARSR